METAFKVIVEYMNTGWCIYVYVDKVAERP